MAHPHEIVRVLKLDIGLQAGARYARKLANFDGPLSPEYADAAQLLEAEVQSQLATIHDLALEIDCANDVSAATAIVCRVKSAMGCVFGGDPIDWAGLGELAAELCRTVPSDYVPTADELRKRIDCLASA